MVLFPVLAAFLASLGWAVGIVLAQRPAQALGAFEFVRVQLLACAAILALACSVMGYWASVAWSAWPAFAASTVIGILLGNLAMVEALRRGGPRRLELVLTMKAPFVAGMAFVAFGESLTVSNLVGALITLIGISWAVLFSHHDPDDGAKTRRELTVFVLLGLTAAGSQGFGFLVLKPAMEAGTDPMAASAIRLLGAAFLISLVALWPARAFRCTTDVTPHLLGSTILPGFIGYGVSSTLLLYAFANFDAGISAVLGSLSPVLVLPVLWMAKGQRPQRGAIIGALLCVLGTAIIVLG